MATETRKRKVEECIDDLVKLQSSDGKILAVKKAAASQSVFINNLIEDVGTKDDIPLQLVSSEILEKVMEYCKYHADHPPRPMETADDIDNWDVEFLKVDRSTLSQVGIAAHFLHIPSLQDLVCRSIAQIIMACETPGKVREMLQIQNDFTAKRKREKR